MGLDMELYKRKRLSSEEDKKLDEMQEVYTGLSSRLNSLCEEVERSVLGCKKLGDIDDFNEFESNRNKIIELIKGNSEISDIQAKIRELQDEANKIVETEDIGDWRKHADLNGYFTQMYYDRGGVGEFNCKELELTKEDCEEVLRLARLAVSGEDSVGKHEGYFWGESNITKWENTVEIFEEVLKNIDFDKYMVLYSCWY